MEDLIAVVEAAQEVIAHYPEAVPFRELEQALAALVPERRDHHCQIDPDSGHPGHCIECGETITDAADAEQGRRKWPCGECGTNHWTFSEAEKCCT